MADDILREITAMHSTEQLLEMRREYQKSIEAIDEIMRQRKTGIRPRG